MKEYIKTKLPLDEQILIEIDSLSLSLYQPQKENEKMNNTQSVILALAQRSAKNQTTDEFSLPEMTNGMSDELKAAIVEIEAEQSKQVIKDAAKEILSITRTASEQEANIIDDIRAVRREAKMKEDQLQARLSKIREARTYAFASSNYVPLMVSLGQYSFSPLMMAQHANLFLIPEAETIPVEAPKKEEAAPKGAIKVQSKRKVA